MKTLQRIQLIVKDGKVDSKESKGDPKAIADSVADELIQQAKEVDLKSIRGIKTVEIWEEVKADKSKSKDKK